MNIYRDFLQISSNSSVKELHEYKTAMAYKRPRNIKVIEVIKSKFSETSELKFSSSKCKRPRCTYCSRIIESVHLSSSQTVLHSN